MARLSTSQLKSGIYAITGSLNGTSSFANNSIFAVTASYALAGNLGPGGDVFRIATGAVTASVSTTASSIFTINSGSSTFFTVNNQGSTTISSSASNIFIIRNQNNTPVLTVSQSGVLVIATQSVELTGTAPNGGIYFTSSSFFVGLD
jgi:hypothetical protein